MLVDNHNVIDIINKLKSFQDFIIDIETTGLDIYNDDYIIGIGLGTLYDDAFYFPFRHSKHNVDISYLKDVIDIINNANRIIGYNIKFDLGGLSKEGLKINKQKLIDVIVMARLCSFEHFPSLDLISVSNKFIGNNVRNNKQELQKYKRANKIKNAIDIDSKFMSEYCCYDVKLTHELYNMFEKKIIDLGQLEIWNIEIEATKTLFFIELNGMKIDAEYRDRMIESLRDKLQKMTQEIYEIAGEEFNINSPKQLDGIFNKLNIRSLSLTMKGNPSWDASSLFLINHPLSHKIQKYRILFKLYTTYFEPYKNINTVHASFNNWGTVTGRLSCSHPNLQNIPRYQESLSGVEVSEFNENQLKILERVSQVKTKTGSIIGGSRLESWKFTGRENLTTSESISVKKLFVPDKDFTLFSFDFSQMEIRIFASYLRNVKLTELMQNSDFDFHSYMSEVAFDNKKGDKEHDFYRHLAKALTFGIIYGMGVDTLANFIDKNKDDAIKLRKAYLDKLSGVEDFISEINNKLKTREFIYNRFGRRYYIPIGKEYLGVNYLVQGTAGDIMKDVMNHARVYLSNKLSRMVNQIHDEVLIEIHNDEEYVIKDIKDILESNKLNIPLYVNIYRCYPSWADKEEYKIKDSSI